MIWKKITKAIKNIDIYGKPVQLTYKGKEKFRTTLGGFFSLLILLLLLSIVLYKLQLMILRKETQVKKNSLIYVSNEYSDPENLSKKNISFAFKLKDYWGKHVFDDPHYGQFKLYQYTYTIKINETTGSAYRDLQLEEIPYSKCQWGKNYFYGNENLATLYSLDTFFCPDRFNLTLQGNWYAPVFSFVNLQWVRCYEPTCANDTEFESWFKKIVLEQLIVSSYFDPEDYVNPIKYNLEENYLSLQPGRSITFNTFFKKNIIKLSDNLMGLFNNKEDDYFYSMHHNDYFSADEKEGPGEGFMYFQEFMLYKEYDIYERSVYTVTGVLQDVGGFYNACFFIGLVIFSRFQKTLFFSSLISNLYLLRDNSTAQVGQKKAKLQDMESSENTLRQLHGNGILAKQLTTRMTQRAYDNDFILMLRDYLQMRQRIKFNLTQILWNSLRNLFICKSKLLDGKVIQDNLKNIEKFEIGKYRVLHDFDCINLLRSLRDLQALKSILLKDYQSSLLQYSKKSFIDYKIRKNAIRMQRSSTSDDQIQKEDKDILEKLAKIKPDKRIDSQLLKQLIVRGNFKKTVNKSIQTPNKLKIINDDIFDQKDYSIAQVHQFELKDGSIYSKGNQVVKKKSQSPKKQSLVKPAKEKRKQGNHNSLNKSKSIYADKSIDSFV